MNNSGSILNSSAQDSQQAWSQVYALSITETVSWGILYYSFAVVLTPMQGDLGWSKGQLTGAFSLALLVSGLVAYPVGREIDRRGARRIMTAGSVIGTLLVFAWARVSDLTFFYLIWTGIGVAMGAVLYEPAFAVIAQWFEQGRNRALTVLTLCAGLASTIFVPVAERLLSEFGWRTTLLILGAILGLITIPLHAFVLQDLPDKKNFIKEKSNNNSTGTTIEVPDSALRKALRQGIFWQLTAAFCLKTAAAVAVIVHLISYLTERHYDSRFAALVVAVIGIAQLPGRLFFAWVSHLISSRTLITGLFVLQITALILLYYQPQGAWIWIFAVIFGAGNGAVTPARASLIADRFGTMQYASIAGLIAMIVTIAQAGAPIGAGLLYDWRGNYDSVMWAAITASIASTVLIFIATTVQPATWLKESNI